MADETEYRVSAMRSLDGDHFEATLIDGDGVEHVHEFEVHRGEGGISVISSDDLFSSRFGMYGDTRVFNRLLTAFDEAVRTPLHSRPID